MSRARVMSMVLIIMSDDAYDGHDDDPSHSLSLKYGGDGHGRSWRIKWELRTIILSWRRNKIAQCDELSARSRKVHSGRRWMRCKWAGRKRVLDTDPYYHQCLLIYFVWCLFWRMQVGWDGVDESEWMSYLCSLVLLSPFISKRVCVCVREYMRFVVLLLGVVWREKSRPFSLLSVDSRFSCLLCRAYESDLSLLSFAVSLSLPFFCWQNNTHPLRRKKKKKRKKKPFVWYLHFYTYHRSSTPWTPLFYSLVNPN